MLTRQLLTTVPIQLLLQAWTRGIECKISLKLNILVEQKLSYWMSDEHCYTDHRFYITLFYYITLLLYNSDEP